MLVISPLLRSFALPTTYTRRETRRSKGFTALDCAVSRVFVIVCGWRLYYQVGCCFYCPDKSGVTLVYIILIKIFRFIILPGVLSGSRWRGLCTARHRRDSRRSRRRILSRGQTGSPARLCNARL